MMKEILIVFCVCVIMCVGVYLFDKFVVCPNFSEATGLETKYNFWAGGCFAEIKEGGWIYYDNYQGVNIK